MESAKDDLAEVLALVSLYAEAMSSERPVGQIARVEANREVLESLIGELEQLSAGHGVTSEESDEQAAHGDAAIALRARLGAAAAGHDEVGVEALLAEITETFPPAERDSTAPIGFLSLLTFHDETEEAGGR